MGAGVVIQNPRKIFPSKNMETYIENSMINLYENTEKVTLVSAFRPPIKSCPILPYSIIM